MIFFENRRERYKIYGILGFFVAAVLVVNPQKNSPIAQDYIQSYSAGKEALRMKEYEKALSLFQKALDQNPNYTDALTGMGLANDRIGDEYRKLASQYYTKALVIDPKYPEALENKGEYFIATGKLKKAYDNYQVLLKVDAIEAEDLRESLDRVLKEAKIVLVSYEPK